MYRTSLNRVLVRHASTQTKRVWQPRIPRQSSTAPATATSRTSSAVTADPLQPTPIVVPHQTIPHQTLATVTAPDDADSEQQQEIPEINASSQSTATAPSSSSLPQSSFPSNSTFIAQQEAVSPFDSISVSASSVPVAPLEIDWSTSYHGLSSQPFSQRQAEILMRPLEPPEIEIKPDGLLYLPEILYRRILNQAFGPGGWGMVPRGEMTVMKSMVTREWGLVAGGRLVSVARGEQTYFDPSGLPTATEGCKSNALMRCCKDLGIASELWDPGFIRQFKAQHCVEAWTEHGSTKKKQKRWRKKGNKFEYPYKEATA